MQEEKTQSQISTTEEENLLEEIPDLKGLNDTEVLSLIRQGKIGWATYGNDLPDCPKGIEIG